MGKRSDVLKIEMIWFNAIIFQLGGLGEVFDVVTSTNLRPPAGQFQAVLVEFRSNFLWRASERSQII
jgi:hypothetical protein